MLWASDANQRGLLKYGFRPVGTSNRPTHDFSRRSSAKRAAESIRAHAFGIDFTTMDDAAESMKSVSREHTLPKTKVIGERFGQV